MQKRTGFFSNLKIKNKILVFVAALVLFLTAAFLFVAEALATDMVLSRIRQANERNMYNIGEYFSLLDASLTANLRHLETGSNVRQLLGEEERGSHDWSLDALLQDVSNNARISALELYDLDGVRVASTDGGASLNTQALSQAQLDKLLLLNGNNLWIDSDYISAGFSAELSVYRLLRDEGNAPFGIVRAGLDTTQMSDIYNYVGFSAFSEIYLISGRSNLLLPKSGVIPLLRLCQQRFEEYKADTPASALYKSGSGEYVLFDQYFKDYDIFVVSLIKYSDVQSETALIRLIVYLLGGICLALVSLFSLAMARSISRPITALSSYMQRVRNGELGLRGNDPAKDEIGQLSRDMDSMLDRLIALMEEIKTAQKRKRMLELNALQMQITPHFLYNSLDSLSSLALMGDTETGYTMSRALSMFYRGVLSDGRAIVRLSEEIEIARNYLDVQAIRYMDQFTYTLEIEESLYSIGIVKMTLQPLVENAIYHGIRGIQRPGAIRVTGRAQGERAILHVEDNGRGMREAPENAGQRGDLILHRGGFGLHNVHQRLQLYFGSDFGLRVFSAPGEGTTVEISLPLTQYEEKENDFGSDRG